MVSISLSYSWQEIKHTYFLKCLTTPLKGQKGNIALRMFQLFASTSQLFSKKESKLISLLHQVKNNKKKKKNLNSTFELNLN